MDDTVEEPASNFRDVDTIANDCLVPEWAVLEWQVQNVPSGLGELLFEFNVNQIEDILFLDLPPFLQIFQNALFNLEQPILDIAVLVGLWRVFFELVGSGEDLFDHALQADIHQRILFGD